MSRAFLYRLSLTAPLAAPLMALTVLRVLGDPFLLPALLLGTALLYTRWTYPFFAITVLVWTRRWSVEQLEQTSVWLPIAYAPLCGLEMAAFYAHTWFDARWWANFADGAVLAIFLGYAYVGITRLLVELATRHESPPVTARAHPIAPSP